MEHINEMAYPVHFNMDEFKSLKSYSKRVQYCNQHLERLGSGSARIAYKIDEQKVLKLAKNEKGIAQNEEEISLANYFDDIVTKCFEYDKDSLWCEMELAKKAKKTDFKRLTGHSFDFMCDFVQREKESRVCPSIYGSRVNHSFDEEYNELINSIDYEYSPFDYISDFISNTGLNSIGDLQKISSWGIITDKDGDDILVLVDFGLTDEVFDKYYKIR